MIHKTQKFNMKSEGRAYREIYAFYFFAHFTVISPFGYLPHGLIHFI